MVEDVCKAKEDGEDVDDVDDNEVSAGHWEAKHVGCLQND